MDSKYTSMGQENGDKKNTFKRKNFMENVNIKKHKSNNVVTKSICANGFKVKNGIDETPNKQSIGENLQEARKLLPVYTVRGR